MMVIMMMVIDRNKIGDGWMDGWVGGGRLGRKMDR